jgi:hypothetical protein
LVGSTSMGNVLVDIVVRRVVTELQSRFKKFMATYDPGSIPTDLLPAAFQTAVRHGGVAEWEFALRVLKDPNQVTLKSSAMFVFYPTSTLLPRTMQIGADSLWWAGVVWQDRKTQLSSSVP